MASSFLFIEIAHGSYSVQNYIISLNYARFRREKYSKSYFFQKNDVNICVIRKKVLPLQPLKKKHRGVEQLVARQAHNLEVARSNPASATTIQKQVPKGLAFLGSVRKNIRSSGFILDNRIISLANSFVVQTIAKSHVSLLHLGEHLLVITVGGSCCVLHTTVPQSDRLLDIVFGVVVLLDNKEHLL